jgi:hypothetical protein
MAGGSGFQPRFTRAIAVTPLEKQRDASKNRSHNQKQQIQNYKVSFPIRLDARGQRQRSYETFFNHQIWFKNHIWCLQGSLLQRLPGTQIQKFITFSNS